MLELECLKIAVLKILKKGRYYKGLIPEKEIALPKNVLLLLINKYYFLIRDQNLLTILKSDNHGILERTSTIIDIPNKKSKIEYTYGIKIESETIPLLKINNW